MNKSDPLDGMSPPIAELQDRLQATKHQIETLLVRQRLLQRAIRLAVKVYQAKKDLPYKPDSDAANG